MIELLKDYLDENSIEDIKEPIQNALYPTGNLTTKYCNVLAEGIILYLYENNFKIIKKKKKNENNSNKNK
jgi:hypothetical protein